MLLGLFFAGNILFATGLIFHAFVYNFYLEALGLSVQVMGHAGAAMTSGSLVALIPAGALVDQKGPTRALLIGTVVMATGLGLGAVVVTPWAIYTAAAIAGAGSGFWRAAMAPVLMRLTALPTRARAFAWSNGLIVAWSGIGVAMAGVTPAWLSARWGLAHLPALRVALALGAVGSGASLPFFRALRLRAEPAHTGPPGAAASAATPDVARRILPLIGLIAVWLLGPALVTPFLNIFFSREHGAPISSIGIGFGVVNWVWALVLLASGELTTRFGVRRALFVSVLCFSPAIWGLSLVHSLQLAWVMYALQGLIAPLNTPFIDQWLLDETPPTSQGIVSSWRQVTADATTIVGASLGGHVLAQGTFGTLFLLAGTVALAGAGGLIASVRARPAVRPEAPQTKIAHHT